MTALAVFTGAALLLSIAADRRRTWAGIVFGARMFVKILPALVLMVAAVGLLLSALNPRFLESLFGGAGLIPFLTGLMVGAVALIPGFIAFPLAGLLRAHGVSTAVLAAFVTSLLMVGVVTLPLEVRFFGRKAALWRNLLSLAAAAFVALVMAVVLR
ncbi:MAG: permease [Candidatus Aminicenantes bacterium]|nr:permease [Candidatus Aminicenantes bacterium]